MSNNLPILSDEEKQAIEAIKSGQVAIMCSELNGVPVITLVTLDTKDNEVGITPIAVLVNKGIFPMLKKPE